MRMIESLSDTAERLIREQLDQQNFASADDVVCAALRLLGQYQAHQQLRADVKEGFDQIAAGKATVLENDEALHAFFADIKSRGRQRLAATEQT